MANVAQCGRPAKGTQLLAEHGLVVDADTHVEVDS